MGKFSSAVPGNGTRAFFDYETEATPPGYFGFRVSVSGLSGGHSGGISI